jgi:hypothetical protein
LRTPRIQDSRNRERLRLPSRAIRLPEIREAEPMAINLSRNRLGRSLAGKSGFGDLIPEMSRSLSAALAEAKRRKCPVLVAKGALNAVGGTWSAEC